MTENNSLRIATFNLHHGAPADKYLAKPELVGEACAALDADILALQEVDRYVWRSRFRDLANIAAQATGMQLHFARTMFDQGGLYGNALLVKGDIQQTEVVELGGDYKTFKWRGNQRNYMREPRNAIVATAVVRGQEIAVAATHLGGLEEVRRQQFGQVMAALACRPPNMPRIVLGDLNTNWGTVHKWLKPYDMALAERQLTVPVHSPKRSIDHIATSGMEILRVEALPFAISDHLALVADASIVTLV